jgi:hypothetical protein
MTREFRASTHRTLATLGPPPVCAPHVPEGAKGGGAGVPWSNTIDRLLVLDALAQGDQITHQRVWMYT